MKTYVTTFLLIILFIGCINTTTVNLNEQSATQLAVDLANQECKKLYEEQPFLPKHYKATFSDGKWHWGYIDIAGIRGFSTEVSFKKDGTDKKVEVQLYTIEGRRVKTSTPKKERRTIIKK